MFFHFSSVSTVVHLAVRRAASHGAWNQEEESECCDSTRSFFISMTVSMMITHDNVEAYSTVVVDKARLFSALLFLLELNGGRGTGEEVRIANVTRNTICGRLLMPNSK